MKLISLSVYHARAKPTQKLLRVHRVWSTRRQQLHQLMGEFFLPFFLVWLEFLVSPVCLAECWVGGVVGGGWSVVSLAVYLAVYLVGVVGGVVGGV